MSARRTDGISVPPGRPRHRPRSILAFRQNRDKDNTGRRREMSNYLDGVSGRLRLTKRGSIALWNRAAHVICGGTVDVSLHRTWGHRRNIQFPALVTPAG